MNIICIVLGMTFIVIAIAFFLGIALNWIKAYREMPKKEQQKIRTDRLSKNVGCVFLSCGIILAVSGFSTDFKDAAFLWCMIIWLMLTGIDVAFITKSTRYRV